MNIQQAFKVLEIEITQEPKVIKGAYARLVKKYHPEEHPEEWQRVHGAYEIAMNYAGRKKDIDADVESFKNIKHKEFISWEKSIEKGEEVSNFAAEIFVQEEAEFDFQNIENLFEQERKKRRDERDNILVEALNRISELEERKNQRAKQWEYVLGVPEIQAARTNPAFLYFLGDFLGKIKIDTASYKKIKLFLADVCRELQDDSLHNERENASLIAWRVADEELEKAYWSRGAGTLKKLFANAIFLITLLTVLFVIVRVYIFADKLSDHKNPNQVILQLQQVDAQGGLWFGRKCSFPSEYVDNHWRVWSGGISDAFCAKYGLNIEGDNVICFYIGNYATEIDDVKVFVSMEDFGLESGNYEVWQYDGKNYGFKAVYDTENTVYPYEKQGKLYIPTKVYKVEDDTLEVDEYHPVVIIKKDSEN